MYMRMRTINLTRAHLVGNEQLIAHCPPRAWFIRQKLMLAPRPKRACSTSRHVASKWQESWRKYHLAPSKKGAPYAFCTLCSSDLSIGGGVT